jgi:hypothetical protein
MAVAELLQPQSGRKFINIPSLLAAKRRKNAAHGASRGYKWKMIEPQRGGRKVLIHKAQARGKQQS